MESRRRAPHSLFFHIAQYLGPFVCVCVWGWVGGGREGEREGERNRHRGFSVSVARVGFWLFLFLPQLSCIGFFFPHASIC